MEMVVAILLADKLVQQPKLSTHDGKTSLPRNDRPKVPTRDRCLLLIECRKSRAYAKAFSL